jgi:hypothetical protein
MDLTSTHLVDNIAEWMGARFTGITIPAGSTFNPSYMTWQFPSGTTDEPQVRIHGEDTAAPLTYSSGANNISGRTITTASVDFDNANLGAPGSFNTPSIATILAELLASYSYSSGVMAFQWHQPAAGTRCGCLPGIMHPILPPHYISLPCQAAHRSVPASALRYRRPLVHLFRRP